MSKSGSTHYYMGKLQPKGHVLSKGRGMSFDHFKREMMKKVFAMKMSGKTDEEIYDYLNSLAEGEKNDG